AERIGGKQSISASVPVGRIAGVAGVVEDSNADHRITCVARQGAPSSASSPRVAALSSFTGEIHAGGGVYGASGDWSGVDLGRVAVCVHEDATLLFRRLEPACDAHSEHTFLVVAEDGPIEGLEGDDQIDDSGMVAMREDVARGLLENVCVLTGC